MQEHHKGAYKSVWFQSNCATKKVANPVWNHSHLALLLILQATNPVWTQWNFTAALGDSVVGRFFALEDGSGVSTAASGLIRFGKFRQNPDNFSKIRKNLQKLGNLLKVFETSCNLRNDLEPPL